MNLNHKEKRIQIKEYKNIIDESEKLQIISLIKEGNPESILAQLSNINISKYLDILIRSKKLYLFTCILENEIIGYAILAEKPKYLINEFKDIKFRILYDLISNLNVLTILDIIISSLRIDLIKIERKNRKVLNDNLNLNLIAIKDSFRSKGYGKLFLDDLIKKFSKNKNFNSMCCETYSEKAESFYIKKFDFDTIGKKLRTKGLLTVLVKKFDLE